MLFGKIPNFDQKEFYMTCARVRTIEQHVDELAGKKFDLEHTKPLFNENKIMSLANLYYYHTFMETFKILKYFVPSSIHDLLNFILRNSKLTLILPLVKLDTTQQNFAFKAASIWNKLKDAVFSKCTPHTSGIVIPGSAEDSDLSASIVSIKNKLKNHLLTQQSTGDSIMW